MTPLQALRLAGPDAVLAARPRGVVHVVRPASLTPSGRFIPRACRSVCRAHTGLLHVVTPDRTLPPASTGDRLRTTRSRVCARCSACLSRSGRQAEQHHPTVAMSRDVHLASFAGLDPFDLWLAAAAADTEAEVDAVAHAALATLGHVACTRPVRRPDGQQLVGLHEHIGRHRARVHISTERENRRRTDIDLAAVAAIGRRKAERAAIRSAREERIEQIGIRNAQPTPTHRPKGAHTP